MWIGEVGVGSLEGFVVDDSEEGLFDGGRR